tara:strand:+ start:2698 stop:3429 length:732 start_codon:yes stop_codon:yes gene_type:complete
MMMMMMMQFSLPKLSCRRQTRSTREDTTPEEEDAEEGGNIFARVRSLLTASSSTSSSSANPTNTREKERKNERTKALFLLFFFYVFRVSPPVQICALLWINASRTSTEREGERERSLLRLRGREEAGKRDESSSSAESFRNSFKSALRARIEWRSFIHREFFDDDESILETCHCWERREHHHHHEEEEQQQQKSTTTRENEEKNNNNKTRDEMSNVANGVVLAQRRENFRRREGVAKEIHHQR